MKAYKVVSVLKSGVKARSKKVRCVSANTLFAASVTLEKLLKTLERG